VLAADKEALTATISGRRRTDVEFDVVFNTATGEFGCQCGLYRRSALPCPHMVRCQHACTHTHLARATHTPAARGP
jgi:hypothetical protein